MLSERMQTQAIINLLDGQSTDLPPEQFSSKYRPIYEILLLTSPPERPKVLTALGRHDPTFLNLTEKFFNEQPGQVTLDFSHEEFDILSKSDPEIEYLWEDWLPRRELSIVVADPGVGKSAWVLDLARRMLNSYAMPNGANAQRKRNNILYIDAEDYRIGINRRINHWRETGDWPRLNSGFYIMPYPETDVLDFAQPRYQEQLIERVVSLAPDWIIIDSLTSSLINYVFDQDVIATLVFFKRLVREYDLALTFLHHNSKSSRNRDSADTANVSGAGLFARRSRVIIGLDYAAQGTKVDKATDPRRVFCIKTNERWPDDLHFYVKSDGVGFYLQYYEQGAFSLKVKVSNRDIVLDAIKGLGEEATIKNIVEETGFTRGYLSTVLKELLEQGKITKKGYGKPYELS